MQRNIFFTSKINSTIGGRFGTVQNKGLLRRKSSYFNEKSKNKQKNGNLQHSILGNILLQLMERVENQKEKSCKTIKGELLTFQL